MSAHHQLLSYTKLLSSHIGRGLPHHALTIFHKIITSPSLSPDPFVLSLGLKVVALLNLPRLGSAVHARAYKPGFLSDPFVSSSLIAMYGKCVSLSSARQLFDEISQRNVVVWNTIISLYCLSNQISSALQLFHLMDIPPVASSFNSIISLLSASPNSAPQAIEFYRLMQSSALKPNLITLLALLPACVAVAALNSVKEIHGFALRDSIYPHPHLSSGLVEAYGRCGCLSNSRNVFDEMSRRDVVTWSAMISAYALNGEAASAFEIFHEMEFAGVRPDGIAFLGVLKACSHAGLPNKAIHYFSRMHKDYGIQVGSDHYACLVDVLGRAGRLREAYEVVKGMPMESTVKAWGALLGACRNYGEVELAEIAGRVLFQREPDNAGNYVILASIYAGAGMFEEAEGVRRSIKERDVKRVPGSSWVIAQET